MRLKTLFLLGLGILTLWFLYIERDILTPFILGAIFAYLLNPLVNFFYRKAKVPRLLAISVLYTLIITSVVYVGYFLTRRIIIESVDLHSYTIYLLSTTKMNLSALPDWMQPYINDTITQLTKSKIFSVEYLFTLFPQAISRIVSFIIFVFSGFYFLKEGHMMYRKFLSVIPQAYVDDVEQLTGRINTVFNGYLRGQLFIVFLVSAVLFASLSIIGIRFALVIAVFAGLAEIVPFIGPIVATSVVALVALATGTNNFGLPPVQAALLVSIVFFVVRQIQDYFVNPHILGRITKLHPLIILFSVLAGEHIGGIIGLLLAVPVAGAIKILLEFFLTILAEQDGKAIKNA